MKKSASEILNNLEMRVARLERQSSVRLKNFDSLGHLLRRLNEHEMNVDQGDERPANEGSLKGKIISFEEVVRLLEKAGRDGRGLTSKEIEDLDEYGGWVELEAP